MGTHKILIVGLQPFDAGKTTVCKALIHGLKEVGVNLTPFKPHAGISYWSQFDAFQKCLERGSLVSSDILELEEAAQSRIPLEVLNPVNRLSGPSVERGLPAEKQTFREFIAERFTHHENTLRHIYFLNGTINLSQMRDMREFYLRVKKRATKLNFLKSFPGLVKAYVDHFEKATSSSYRHLKERPLIIESFNDAAYPFERADDCKTVLCASLNAIYLLNRDKYFKAVEAHGGEKSKLQLTLSDIYSSSLIREKFQIYPLTDQERGDPDKLAQNYSQVIQKITDTSV